MQGRKSSGDGEPPGRLPSQEPRNWGLWCWNPSGGLEEGTQRPRQEKGEVWVGETRNEGELEGAKKGQFWKSLLPHLSCEATGSLEGFSEGKR